MALARRIVARVRPADAKNIANPVLSLGFNQLLSFFIKK